MEKTPLSMRKHIVIFGNTNSGKSSLFNALLGQDVSIVSEVKGTTTDPVTKAMELIGYGPVAIVDTAGFDDETQLGKKRVQKTEEILKRADLILWVNDINSPQESINFGEVPFVKIYTKCDKMEAGTIEEKENKEPDAVFIKEYSEEELSALMKKISEILKKQQPDDESLLKGLVPEGSFVVMVVPIDSAAPKGRLILPQVQAIRDCLDNKIKSIVVRPDMLEETLNEMPGVSLVITDSQAFFEVDKIVPAEIPLTSFSMLLANQKGRIRQLVDGAKRINSLQDGDNILMIEACTHSSTHEDIGKVKIPALLQKKTGKKLNFTHLSGYDFPENVDKYSLVIQCGGCMINKRTIQNRLEFLEEKNIPVTNYGVILSALNGILERTSKIFIK